jgi:hypothetical protein
VTTDSKRFDGHKSDACVRAAEEIAAQTGVEAIGLPRRVGHLWASVADIATGWDDADTSRGLKASTALQGAGSRRRFWGRCSWLARAPATPWRTAARRRHCG